VQHRRTAWREAKKSSFQREIQVRKIETRQISGFLKGVRFRDVPTEFPGMNGYVYLRQWRSAMI
jgi:hypothetical protein